MLGFECSLSASVPSTAAIARSAPFPPLCLPPQLLPAQYPFRICPFHRSCCLPSTSKLQCNLRMLATHAAGIHNGSPQCRGCATQVRDAGNLLTRAGFAIPSVDTDDVAVHYQDPMQLVRHLRQAQDRRKAAESLERLAALHWDVTKTLVQCFLQNAHCCPASKRCWVSALISCLCSCRALGETNAAKGRQPRLKQTTWQAAADKYRERFGDKDGTIPATFQVCQT